MIISHIEVNLKSLGVGKLRILYFFLCIQMDLPMTKLFSIFTRDVSADEMKLCEQKWNFLKQVVSNMYECVFIGNLSTFFAAFVCMPVILPVDVKLLKQLRFDSGTYQIFRFSDALTFRH